MHTLAYLGVRQEAACTAMTAMSTVKIATVKFTGVTTGFAATAHRFHQHTQSLNQPNTNAKFALAPAPTTHEGCAPDQ